MKSRVEEERIDVQALLQEEADMRQDLIVDAESHSDRDLLEQDALRAQHEDLRRQVALLKSKLGATDAEASSSNVNAKHKLMVPGMIVGWAALIAGIVAVWSLT